MIRLENIKIYADLTEEEVINKALKKYKIAPDDILNTYIVKKSIDARDKANVHYNYAIDISLQDETKYPTLKHLPEKKDEQVSVKRISKYNPVIIGSGPAGLFCALTLVKYGFKPIIIEQGSSVDERIKYVTDYRQNGRLVKKCNVQFGEGGAGTFSDGKLTTGINSPYVKKVLTYFHEFGAPKEILYLNKPHIGTDNLVKIIKNIRTYIEKHGGKYYFDTKFTDVKEHDGVLEVVCDKQIFITDTLVLAVGHSARDTFKLLKKKNFQMIRKNFSVGVRIEHKQQMINESQYGNQTKLHLPSAEYKLAYHNNERSCYTFCMCPGGEVIASSSEKESIVTNGMSTYKRDKENANAALLVNIMTTDFPGTDPLAGMYFQEELEHKAYLLGGSKGYAPVQRVADYLKNVPSTKIGSIKPTYLPGYTLANLNELFPDFVNKTLKEGILYFDKKIKNFANPDAILTGVETRSSSPITIIRDESLTCQHELKGIYPCGEGAGYAGGITSSAVDGIKVALKIIEKE